MDALVGPLKGARAGIAAIRPKISSVMLCWNRLVLSQRCLASYLATVETAHELFVIDNASTDETGRWVESLEGTAGVTGIVRMQRNDPAAALNEALQRCSGEILHIMENDYEYLTGWDRYVANRFARISTLGQLAPVTGYDYVRAGYHEGVHLARDNVCTTSFLRRAVFFEDGVRVSGHYRGKCYPDDYALSTAVRRAGWLVAWSDVEIAHHIGLDLDEQRRDPDYYIRDYALKLFSLARLRGHLGHWLRLDFHDAATLVRRLARVSRFKLARLLARRGGATRG
jgi:glycosyltransferase involved in cell wall biosynthesis